ncbi:hypothetical protein HK096_003980, partial [Nowakowskiella sp. JEL0078]
MESLKGTHLSFFSNTSLSSATRQNAGVSDMRGSPLIDAFATSSASQANNTASPPMIFRLLARSESSAKVSSEDMQALLATLAHFLMERRLASLPVTQLDVEEFLSTKACESVACRRAVALLERLKAFERALIGLKSWDSASRMSLSVSLVNHTYKKIRDYVLLSQRAKAMDNQIDFAYESVVKKVQDDASNDWSHVWCSSIPLWTSYDNNSSNLARVKIYSRSVPDAIGFGRVVDGVKIYAIPDTSNIYKCISADTIVRITRELDISMHIQKLFRDPAYPEILVTSANSTENYTLTILARSNKCFEASIDSTLATIYLLPASKLLPSPALHHTLTAHVRDAALVCFVGVIVWSVPSGWHIPSVSDTLKRLTVDSIRPSAGIPIDSSREFHIARRLWGVGIGGASADNEFEEVIVEAHGSVRLEPLHSEIMNAVINPWRQPVQLETVYDPRNFFASNDDDDDDDDDDNDDNEKNDNIHNSSDDDESEVRLSDEKINKGEMIKSAVEITMLRARERRRDSESERKRRSVSFADEVREGKRRTERHVKAKAPE